VKRISYSRHAARTFLCLAIIPLTGGVLGKVFGGDPGFRPGLGVGIGLGVLLAVRTVWRRRRGDAWSASARAAGLKAIYSGHAPAIGLEGYRWTDNLFGIEEDGLRLLVGDRMEWHAGYRADAAIGTIDTHRPETADPVQEETFFALCVPGSLNGRFALGRRKSLLEVSRGPSPDGGQGVVMQEWSAAHPAWRLEGEGDWFVGTRPNHVASAGELGDYVRLARELGRSLQSATR
jgi:hypothetical protein